MLAITVMTVPTFASADSAQPKPTIVLVHGAWADGSSWSAVVELLQALHDEQAIHFVSQDGFLPMGSPLPADAMTARAQAEAINSQVIVYLNRLSDLLFVLAREYNNNGQDDVLWVPGKTLGNGER